MFNVNFKKMAVWLTPQFLRQSKYLLLLQAFTWPLRQKYDSLIMFMNAQLYRLAHNSQVCYLEAMLNDKFDFTQRRIYITDFDGKKRIYFWPDADERDVNFGVDVYFWPDSDYADSGIDFTIHLPTDVVTTNAKMIYLNSLMATYKLPSKNYNIVRI